MLRERQQRDADASSDAVPRRQPDHPPTRRRSDQPEPAPSSDSPALDEMAGAFLHLPDAVVLVEGLGYSVADVADLLDIKPTTVRNHLDRGLRRLRRPVQRFVEPGQPTGPLDVLITHVGEGGLVGDGDGPAAGVHRRQRPVS